LDIDNGIADLSEEDQALPSVALLLALKHVGLTLEAYDELINQGYVEAEKVGLNN
jgi:hypothetical protein